MSPDLIAFLKAWHDWATNGAPEGKPFTRRFGLCYNSYEHDIEVRKALDEVLGKGSFPFGEADYESSYRACTQHECPKRLAWVREKLVEAGELVA